MSVYQDIDNAIYLIKGYDQVKNHYNKINLFPNYSLKHFKKYNLDGKKVLTRINNLHEIFDLMSYNADVVCFSSNRLNKYFIDLLLKLFDKNMNLYLNFIFKDYKTNNIFSKQTFNCIKDELENETYIFFDEIYDYCYKKNISISKLINDQQYDKNVLERYIRVLIKKRFYEVRNNNKVSCWDLDINDASTTFKPGTFNFINLSFEMDNYSNDKLNKLMVAEKRYIDLLKEHGKIQGFVSHNEIVLPEHKIIETRSLSDPNSSEESCKKDYAYVYSK